MGRNGPDRTKRYPSNVPGPFYVDDYCLDCDACRVAAPANFDRNHEGGHAYVKKQPENEMELRLCIDALEGCHTMAIGRDGEEPDAAYCEPAKPQEYFSPKPSCCSSRGSKLEERDRQLHKEIEEQNALVRWWKSLFKG